MQNVNYLDKINYRNQMLQNMVNNEHLKSHMTTASWYKMFMPFLGEDIIKAIDNIDKRYNQSDDSLDYLKFLFEDY